MSADPFPINFHTSLQKLVHVCLPNCFFFLPTIVVKNTLNYLLRMDQFILFFTFFYLNHMVQMDASERLQWDYGYQDRRSWGDDATDALYQKRERE